MMTRRQAGTGLLATAAMAAAPSIAAAQELKPLDLPQPRSEGGMALTAALKLRRSTREYSDRPIPAQTLSDLLWAAFGINRPASGDRTAPYWRHVMVMDIYVVMADGAGSTSRSHMPCNLIWRAISARRRAFRTLSEPRRSTSSMSRTASA